MCFSFPPLFTFFKIFLRNLTSFPMHRTVYFFFLSQVSLQMGKPEEQRSLGFSFHSPFVFYWQDVFFLSLLVFIYLSVYQQYSLFFSTIYSYSYYYYLPLVYFGEALTLPVSLLPGCLTLRQLRSWQSCFRYAFLLTSFFTCLFLPFSFLGQENLGGRFYYESPRVREFFLLDVGGKLRVIGTLAHVLRGWFDYDLGCSLLNLSSCLLFLQNLRSYLFWAPFLALLLLFVHNIE